MRIQHANMLAKEAMQQSQLVILLLVHARISGHRQLPAISAGLLQQGR